MSDSTWTSGPQDGFLILTSKKHGKPRVLRISLVGCISEQQDGGCLVYMSSLCENGCEIAVRESAADIIALLKTGV